MEYYQIILITLILIFTVIIISRFMVKRAVKKVVNNVENKLVKKTTPTTIGLGRQYGHFDDVDFTKLRQIFEEGDYDFIVESGDCSITELLQQVKNKYIPGKKLVVFYQNDYNDNIDVPSDVIVFRSSIIKNTRRPNEFVFPIFWIKVPSFAPLQKGDKPRISFCGSVVSHPCRQLYLNIMKDSPRLETNFIFKMTFWDGKPGDKQTIKDFDDTIESSEFVFSPRGAGNYSYRFYQALKAGRIPVVTNEELVMPFKDGLIDWNSICVFINPGDDIVEKIYEFWNANDIYEVQQKTAKIFNHYIAAGKVEQNLYDQIENNKKFYTISGLHDGFGSQYQARMSGIAICEYKNYEYVHSPFTEMHHNVDVDKLNKFIGIKSNSIPDGTIVENWSDEVHWAERPSIYYTPTVILKLRDYYYSTPKPHISKIDIAIHIRRRDVKKGVAAHGYERFTPNSEYIKIIRSLRARYPSYKILIFSDGTIDEFNDLRLDPSHFRLNTDVIHTFHSLVCAKVLVMAKSSFSYAAAILNKNTIFYTDFWHKPLDNWLRIESLI